MPGRGADITFPLSNAAALASLVPITEIVHRFEAAETIQPDDEEKETLPIRSGVTAHVSAVAAAVQAVPGTVRDSAVSDSVRIRLPPPHGRAAAASIQSRVQALGR